MTATAADTRAQVLARCRDEGFDPVRVAPASVIEDARQAALEAADAGRLDGLDWMTPEWLQRATDPGTFLPGARSVILCAIPYAPSTGDAPAEDGVSRGRVAAYARGRDYHRIFEKKLRRLARTIREEFGAGARATVDYGPLLERPLAAAAGMGWQGKSTMLLVPGIGPWVLLGAIATTLDLEPDTPTKKTCGSCTRCITACPTGAISPRGDLLDSRLCISYHTIENRGPIPRDLRHLFGDWIFGCDDCLTSCPVGRHAGEGHPELSPASTDDARPQLAPLLQLTEERFRQRFQGRPIMRAKRDGFLRNVCIALGNVGTASDAPALVDALHDHAPLVRGHAAWALGRLAERGVAAPGDIRAHLAARLDDEDDQYVREELDAALASLA
ncbi:MAG: tRNA epoxyqueuosine(34) reductase QueG [Dehalococcoidia bacterium]|nr:tRNA epoxyqueuosine(34) reductase QueG [Dehalococcoidia bacterium]